MNPQLQMTSMNAKYQHFWTLDSLSNKNIAFPQRGICIISDKQVGWWGGGGGPKDSTKKKNQMIQ